MNVLFLCTGNSCRSILAEAIFKYLAPVGWHAMSAGSQPTGEIHPYSLKILDQHHINTTGLSSKSWNNLPSLPDVVITVCASAAGESCPLYIGKAIRSHWGLDDPAKASGTEEEILCVFENTYQQLTKGIHALFSQPIDNLSKAPDQLKQELDSVGQKFFN